MPSRSFPAPRVRSRGRLTHLAAAGVAAVALAACSADLDTSGTTAGDPAGDVAADPVGMIDLGSIETGAPESFLWVQTATNGTITGDGEELVLTLEGVPDHLIRFTDRPMRDADVVAPEDTARRWSEFFATSAPNATLTYQLDGSDAPSVLALTLGQPTYDQEAATMTYPATVLGLEPDHLPDATRTVDTPEVEIPEEFGAASLFIDSATPCWQAANGKPLRCAGANLAGITLPSGSSHPGSNFSNADLSGATLAGVDLSRSAFYSTNLDGTNLSGATLKSVSLFEATWNSTDFSKADLSDADLRCTGPLGTMNLTGTILTGARVDLYQGALLGLQPGTDPATGLIVGAEGIPCPV